MPPSVGPLRARQAAMRWGQFWGQRSPRGILVRTKPAGQANFSGADDGIRTRDPHLGKGIGYVLTRPVSSRLLLSAQVSGPIPDDAGRYGTTQAEESVTQNVTQTRQSYP
jgi:hypothetical protein